MRTAGEKPRAVPWWASAAMIGSAACWGLATVMSRDLLETFTAPALLVIQLCASVAVLLLLSLPERPIRHWGTPLRRASWAGLLEPGLSYAVSLAGLALTTAGNASVIGATEPLMVVFLAWLFLRQRPSRRTLLAIVVAIVGLLMISGESLALGVARGNPLGDSLIMLATVFAAAYVVVTARYSELVPPATMASAQQLLGLALALALLWAAEATGVMRQDWAAVDSGMLSLAAISGVVQYALAFWLYLVGLRRLRPAVAALWLTVTPVFGIAGAFVFLGEVPSLLMLLGTAVILGALLATRKES